MQLGLAGAKGDHKLGRENSAGAAEPRQELEQQVLEIDELLQRGPRGISQENETGGITPFHGRGTSSPMREHAFSSNQKNPESH